jgi:hypothetical protein
MTAFIDIGFCILPLNCQLWPTDECSEESETESSEESPTSEICIEEMMVTQIDLASALCLRCSPVFRHTAHILTI